MKLLHVKLLLKNLRLKTEEINYFLLDLLKLTNEGKLSSAFSRIENQNLMLDLTLKEAVYDLIKQNLESKGVSYKELTKRTLAGRKTKLVSYVLINTVYQIFDYNKAVKLLEIGKKHHLNLVVTDILAAPKPAESFKFRIIYENKYVLITLNRSCFNNLELLAYACDMKPVSQFTVHELFPAETNFTIYDGYVLLKETNTKIHYSDYKQLRIFPSILQFPYDVIKETEHIEELMPVFV